MQKEINEKLDMFISEFVNVMKGIVEDQDSRYFKESELLNTISEADKRYFLINNINFEEVMIEVIDTQKYNLGRDGHNINVLKAFRGFFNSFKDMIVNNKDITSQINESYKAFGTTNQQMQVEEPTDSEKDVNFDDEVEFTKVYSNRPKGYKSTKGNNSTEIKLYPDNYGFNCLYVDPLANRLAVTNQLRALETRFSRFLNDKGYFEASDRSLIRDAYRVGRVMFFESQVHQDNFKNVCFEQLEDEGLKNVQLSFEFVSNQIIYSGQCMVVRTSSNNSKIEVKEILMDVPAGYEISNCKIEEESTSSQTTDCNVIVVKGPFFNPDKYDFSLAISKLRACLSKSNANVLIVKGPVVSQNYNKNFEMSHEKAKNSFLELLLELPCANIIYVNEASEKTNIAILPINPLESLGKLIQAPNPCVINIGGYRIGVSDERLLDEMAFNSIVVSKAEKTRNLDLAIKTIWESNSLLPIYSNNIYWDWSHSDLLTLKEPLDVFFLHSGKFDSTVGKHGKTQYVNLKSFSKSTSFGSYATVKLVGEGTAYIELFECEESDN